MRCPEESAECLEILGFACSAWDSVAVQFSVSSHTHKLYCRLQPCSYMLEARGLPEPLALKPGAPAFALGNQLFFQKTKLKTTHHPRQRPPSPPEKKKSVCGLLGWLNTIYLRTNESVLLTNWHYRQDLVSASTGSLKFWSWQNWAAGVSFCPYFCTDRDKTENALTTETQSVKGGREWKVEKRKVERTFWRFSFPSPEPGDEADFSGTVCIFLLLRSTGQNKAKKKKVTGCSHSLDKYEIPYEHPPVQWAHFFAFSLEEEREGGCIP